MSASENEYIHGTHPEEQERLSALNRVHNNRSLERMNLRGGEKILDVGSGLGQLARGMARLVGSDGYVIGVEQSRDQISEASRQADADGESRLVEFREGDAVDLPLGNDEWGTFDVVHTRFVLEHVSDPQAVVKAMVRAARPGGRIILEDDDHDVLRLWPEVEGFEELWHAYIRTYTECGYDPYVGRRLVALLAEAGAVPVRNDWPFFGGCAGTPMFEALAENFVGIIDGARAKILRYTDLDDEAVEQCLRAFKEWKRLPNAAMWYGTFWAEGEVSS